MRTVVCQHCGATFEAQRSTRKFCKGCGHRPAWKLNGGPPPNRPTPRPAGRERQQELSSAWARLRTPEATQDGECWEWPGARTPDNYGNVRRCGQALAHRAAWVEVYGPIPDGMVICHRCDNPPCYRPSHLFLGTHADNVADKMAKGRFWIQTTTKRVKLSDEQVAEIRAARAAGALLPDLAHRYGVSKTLVGLIVRGLRRASPTGVAPAVPAVGSSEPRLLPGRPRPTHCPQGHEYAGYNRATRPNGQVWCRACASSRKRRSA